MRRSLLCGSLCVLLLSSCGGGGLGPEEVLRRATQAGKDLQSSQFDGTASITSTNGDNHVSATLTIQDGVSQSMGRDGKASVSVQGTMKENGVDGQFSAGADVVVFAAKDFYLRLRSFSLAPQSPLVDSDAVTRALNQWWHAALGDRPVTGEVITPDPQLLRTQAAILRVTKEYARETIDGHPCYSYDMEIDPEKLSAFLQRATQEQGDTYDATLAEKLLTRFSAKGHMWIDAESFVLRRLHWDIASLAPLPATVAIGLQLDLRNHNAAPTLQPPEGAQDMAAFHFLRSGSGTVPSMRSSSSSRSSR